MHLFGHQQIFSQLPQADESRVEAEQQEQAQQHHEQQEQDQVEQQQQEQPQPEIIEADTIADTIDAGTIDNDNDAVVERIDDYDDEEDEGGDDDLEAEEEEVLEEEEAAVEVDVDAVVAGQQQAAGTPPPPAASAAVAVAAASASGSGSASGQQRLHSVAVLPSYSTARAPLPPLLRAPRSNHNNNSSSSNNNNNNNTSNNNNNNNTSSSNNSSSAASSSRRTRHFYSNNGSHFSNDMYAGGHKSSSQRDGHSQSHSSSRQASGSGGGGGGSGTRNANQSGHQGVDPLRLLYPNVNENETPLPRCWNPHDKCLNIGLSHNNLRVTYKGVGKQHSEAAGSVRTAYPIPPSCGLYYFEVRIISKGRNGYMGIGLTAQQFRMNRLPGGDKQSYGYHGYDGNSFSSSCNGQSYGPTFTTGDIIGCCVNFLNNTCFYTKNGFDLGIAFRDLPTKLYPTVGLQTPGEEVDANFGQEPFKFDKIEEMMRDMRATILRKIDRYPHLLETPENLMNRLVSTYLVHSGYCKTAEAFNAYTHQPFDEDLASIKTRQKIIKLIQTGKMSQAIENTLRAYPGLLENNKNLWFALKCRQFIEMINGADIEHANNKVTATTQTMPTNQTSVIQSTKAFKHSKTGGNISGSASGNGSASTNTNTNQPQNNTANSAVIKPGDKTDPKIMIIDDNSNKCPEHDSNSMDVEMEPCNSHSNGDSCSNGNASVARNSLDAIDEEMDVDISPSSRNYGRVIEKILEFGKELSSMGQQLEKENLMTEEERQMLEDAFSLIAYSNPWSSPLGWLLCPSRRENVSTTLNSAILESLNFERRPPLEYLVAHAAELLKLIGQNSLGEDAFITIDDVFPQN
ncbi:PREDICTED: ran-binding proteins 9/10 homolog [Drosophila arizonae]|uniref:Ran-binding proteins 9/10 homolog n=1 Tax=Drosophila arizonae TaxID=7263 RepID=A0ABM1PD53_DROAR|nr:PREDICTED: ran-binding proteins 9/10 homolog [Drosophila arizonae]